ncbi:MAG: hypothetical protein ABR538_05905 [Candidatus Binatia bacterium]
MAEILLSVVSLGALCAGWIALQRWIERVEPDLPESRPCGSCCGDKLCEIEKNDPWCTRP